MTIRKAFQCSTEALKWPALIEIAPRFHVAAFSIMKLFPAAYMLKQAEGSGLLGPQTVVTESTSGTFGLALAMICAERSQALELVGDSAIDQTLQSRITGLGANLTIVTEPALIGGIQQARLDCLSAIRGKFSDHFWPAQYQNPNNPASYAELAAMLQAELGDIDCLVGTVGTGGSMCGTAAGLRSLRPQLHVIGVDTHGSVLFGQPDRPGRMLRGLGNSVLPPNVDHTVFNDVHWVGAADAFLATQQLHREHALFMGPTSGAAWLVAAWWARNNPEARVVAILPDEGHRYQSTVYSSEWLATKRLTRTTLPSAPVFIQNPRFIGDTWSTMSWQRRTLSQAEALSA